jgi:hypothetical protein
MIERELLGANDALGVRNLPKFAARGVAGASASTALAEFITVRGWQPVLAEIKVSDVAHLARSLGGQGLYSAEYVPLRELIQNSADAIDARAQIDPEFRPNEGKITIRIAREGAEEDRIISVTDNGLGMSESVLAGPLIDFGNSFWKSPLARSEYPGLQGTLREPRGRFGIGFFSAFMWADEVLVASRPFATGRDDTKVLHFRGGLGRNPILRNALPGEVLGSASTRAESGQERS